MDSDAGKMRRALQWAVAGLHGPHVVVAALANAAPGTVCARVGPSLTSHPAEAASMRISNASRRRCARGFV